MFTNRISRTLVYLLRVYLFAVVATGSAFLSHSSPAALAQSPDDGFTPSAARVDANNLAAALAPVANFSGHATKD